MQDSVLWFPNLRMTPEYLTLCLTGEVGEFANKLKKLIRGDNDSRLNYELREELTDVFIYLANMAEVLGMDLEEWYKAKRIKNQGRFGNR